MHHVYHFECVLLGSSLTTMYIKMIGIYYYHVYYFKWDLSAQSYHIPFDCLEFGVVDWPLPKSYLTPKLYGLAGGWVRP